MALSPWKPIIYKLEVMKMEDTNNGQNKQVNPLVAGLTGAAIGTGIGILATKVMSDKKMRSQIMKTASGMKEKLGGSMDRAFHELRPIAHRISLGGMKKMGRGKKGSARK